MKAFYTFLTLFMLVCLMLIPAIGLWWLTTWLDIVWVFWGAVGLSVLVALVGSL